MSVPVGIVLILIITSIFSSVGNTEPSSESSLFTPKVSVFNEAEAITNATDSTQPNNSTAQTTESDNLLGPTQRQCIKTIQNYITKTRKSVPDYEAELIANTIVHYSAKKNIDPYFIAALIDRESQFNARAISKHGAKGLGQIMDFNHKSLKIDNPFNIEQSVRGTVTYIAMLTSKWRHRPDFQQLALASYLEGPGTISRQGGYYKQHTVKYISDIYKIYNRLQNDQSS